MFDDILKKAVNSIDLTTDEAYIAMDLVMTGKVDEVRLSAFLTALNIKKEKPEELAGFTKAMLDNAEKFSKNDTCIDTCGTGGDKKSMINVSTIAALIASSAGVRIVKHGNRSITSKCGSADLLEALGIKIDLIPERSEKQLLDTGFAFLFAPIYHKAMKYAMPVRRKLNFPTVFNILGPLSNPARVDGQVLGVYKKELVSPVASVLKEIGVKRAMVIHGLDGSDEISVKTGTYIAELKDSEISEYIFEPKRLFNDDTKGSDPIENARITVDILNNKRTGAMRELVLLNAAAVLMVAGKAENMLKGYEIANEMLNKKSGIDKIHEIIRSQN